MAKEKDKVSDLNKMQDVITTYTDYKDSLVLTADDVQAILAEQDFQSDITEDHDQIDLFEDDIPEDFSENNLDA